MQNRERGLLIMLLFGVIVAGIMVMLFGQAEAETRWALCKDYLNVREKPNKHSAIVGYIDSCDSFETDGTIRNGYIRVFGIGEAMDGWVYAGFTVDEQPERVDERYVCVAIRRAACRRWTDGPRISGKAGWIYNGSDVRVFFRTSEWAVTNRGYIASEWLERDPE